MIAPAKGSASFNLTVLHCASLYAPQLRLMEFITISYSYIDCNTWLYSARVGSALVLTYGKQDSHCNPHAWVPRVKRSFYLWMVTNEISAAVEIIMLASFNPHSPAAKTVGFFKFTNAAHTCDQNTSCPKSLVMKEKAIKPWVTQLSDALAPQIDTVYYHI